SSLPCSACCRLAVWPDYLGPADRAPAGPLHQAVGGQGGMTGRTRRTPLLRCAHSIEDVLGKNWQHNIQGRQLKGECDGLRSVGRAGARCQRALTCLVSQRLVPKKLFDDWLAANADKNKEMNVA